jgi:hypothetical protein
MSSDIIVAKRKKHAPIEQLREAGKAAEELLVSKYKIRLPVEQSAIEAIKKKEDAPILPGGPGSLAPKSYLPYPWTLNATRRILFDLTKLWEIEAKSGKVDGENISSFITFVIKGLEMEESKIKKLIKKTEKEKRYDFKFFHQKDAVAGVKSFLVDSFAISILAKQNSSVSEYILWFIDWTNSLLDQWGPQQKNIDGPDPKSKGARVLS